MVASSSSLKFAEPFSLLKLLQKLDQHKYGSVVYNFTTLKELQQYALKLPEFDGYATILTEDFEAKAIWLLDECKQNRYGSVKQLLDALKTLLVEKGYVMKFFAEFPEQPKNYKNKTGNVLVEQRTDYQRYRKELVLFRDKERDRLSPTQKRYLAEQISLYKTKLHDLDTGYPAPRHVDERPAEATKRLASASSDEIHPKRKAIDIFRMANPELSKEEAFEKFSCLELNVRS